LVIEENGMHIKGSRFSNKATTAIMTLFVLGGSIAASAQWTVSNTSHAWSGYNNNFLFTNSSGHDQFRAKETGTTATGFWMYAEQIELAVDAYYWAKTSDSGNLSTYSSEVTSLINGFDDAHPSWWNGSDTYDDDMMWATIAFARAYQALGTSAWLTDAEDAFNKVYSRGLASNGGIYWNSACEASCSSWYENSAANWTFVLAGHIIWNNNGNTGNYKTEADSVFNWAYNTLYNSSTGEVYDGYKSPGIQTADYSYNYGVAIGAASEHGSENTMITNVANYLANDLAAYQGTVGGYKILLDYDASENGSDGGGFNGITMRWLELANIHGLLSSSVQAWAVANITQAWSVRDSSELMWDDWMSSTPSSGTYSWDCSSAMAGMFNWQ
jgi:predicted alpha-1,6-mannanase (GH76 family)